MNHLRALSRDAPGGSGLTAPVSTMESGSTTPRSAVATIGLVRPLSFRLRSLPSEGYGFTAGRTTYLYIAC